MTRLPRSALLMTRRNVLVRAAGALALSLPGMAWGDAAKALEAALAAVLGERQATAGGLKLTTPAIAENGNTVPLQVAVDGPLPAGQYVKAIHLFAADNPSPEVASFFFTPASGRAQVATRIRLARTQQVIALAELSDGSVWRAANEVKVTIGGCGG